LPTPNFAPGEILGTWTRSDPQRGDLFIILSEDGVYTASHGTPEGVIHSGSYSLEGNLLTFRDGWNCAPLPDDTPGQYVARIGAGGRFLFFDLYSDDCADRTDSLPDLRWNRVEP
jgi:hypothetical protein